MWQLVKDVFDGNKVVVEESLFTLGNGYLGIRGCFEEGYGCEEIHSIQGTYINGLYDRIPLIYGESAYGFPTIQDKLPRIVDTQICEIYLDHERVSLCNNQHENYKRVLDYHSGITVRSYEYITKKGKWAKITFERLASLWIKNAFIYRIEVDYEGEIELRSVVDANIMNSGDPKDPRNSNSSESLLNPMHLEAENNRVYSMMKTKSTSIIQSTVIDHFLLTDLEYQFEHELDDYKMTTTMYGRGNVVFEKHCFFTDGLRVSNPHEKAHDLADENKQYMFHDFLAHQRMMLHDYWNHTDIVIEGDENIQASIRFMLFHLLQSTGTDEFSNVSAKGVSGEGYEGHYFWDTEIYVIPLLQMTQPEMAKKLLEYRYHILPFAKYRALELGLSKGATFPWRTISGVECSGYFPAGTAQFHINSDIAYAFIHYHLYNKDIYFLVEYGAEVILETARVWMEIGHYAKGKYNIHTVTGPDEYTALINNNYYTNVMAKFHLEWAYKIYNELSRTDDFNIKSQFWTLCKKIDFTIQEALKMKEAADHMLLPHDDLLGIDAQDDTFLSKPKWPFDQVDQSNYPLLLYFHPLTIYRHQVLKQADTVLAHFLLEDYSDEETIKRSFNYYEEITTHDSSLSACVYGIMASRLGYKDKAYSYFMKSVYLDLEDTHHNTKDGLHMANIAGTCLAVINGFAGYRIKEHGIVFRPTLPKAWTSYQFKVFYQNREIAVYIGSIITFTLTRGLPLKIIVWDEEYILEKVLSFNSEKERIQNEND